MTAREVQESEEIFEVEKFLYGMEHRADENGQDFPLSLIVFAASKPADDEDKTSVAHVCGLIRPDSITPLIHLVAVSILDNPYIGYVLKEALQRAKWLS